MTAIVLGYTAPGRTAAPTVLYAGTDAGAASDISNAPPAGILRTEFFKNPAVLRRRFFEVPASEAPAADPASESPAPRKAK